MKFTLSKIALLSVALLLPAARAAESNPAALQTQLHSARAQLAELRQKFTDDHPRVAEQKAKIAALEKQIAEDPLKPTREVLNMVMPRAATFSIDFPGGSIRTFLAAASKIDGVSISIVSAGDASDLDTPLPPFSLRNTNAMVTLQVLGRLLSPRGFDLSTMEAGQNSAVAVLSRRSTSRPRPVVPPADQFESFQLAPYLVDQTIDDIVGAIRAAWELNPEHDANQLKLKFHPATSILLASGPREGLDLTAKIISQLKVKPKSAVK